MAKCFYDLYKLRTAVREILTSSNATVLHGHSDKGFGCSFCGQYFLKPADLKQHNLQLHSKNIKTFLKGKEHSKFFVKLDITNLECNICNQSIGNIEEVIDHLNSDHNKKIHNEVKKVIFPFKFHGNELRCSDCMELFYTFKALHEHMHSHYSNYICEVCSAGFVTKSSLLLHLTSHGTGSFQCSRCPKVFDTPQKKKNHEAKVHDEKAPKNVCRICNERFKEYYAKEKHIADVHGIKADYRCEECNKTYHCKAHLQGHIKKNHLMMRPHKCMECDMGFYTSNDLKKHMPKHTGSREFKCTVCSKTYARKTTMKQHMRTKHGVNE
ncbi:hypothetical protein NE865_15460 [Phthorimaea operculella]|nr:hypothetical protein NE865_15460 [Phthorimaea operculella]